VVFAVGAFNKDGVEASCKADVKNVEIASEAFFAKSTNGKYAADVAALVTGGYLKEAPSTSTGAGVVTPSTAKYGVLYSGGGSATAPTIEGHQSGSATGDCK
jgi:hypothetical protein